MIGFGPEALLALLWCHSLEKRESGKQDGYTWYINHKMLAEVIENWEVIATYDQGDLTLTLVKKHPEKRV